MFNILQKVLNQNLRPPRSHNPAIPAALDTIVCKSLNKERSQRYQTALELAEDLGRFLSAQRITAKRLGYLYRVGYWARRKPAIAALTAALFLSALGLIGYGIQTRIESARKKREAQREAALARHLGQTIKDLEWRMRTAYLLPLHNADEEKVLVREQMAQLERELSTAGAHGVRLAHYALGRGHLSLHEWEAAQRELQEAERLGLVELELDYALGRVLGERYSIALEEARKSGDKTFLEQRKKELEKEFLMPARQHLARSRALKTVAPNYVEALVDYYHQRYDSALINAQFAQKQERQLYEAVRLEGDVYMARALDLKDRGEYDVAERSFSQAIAHYQRAAETGRSDHTLHEALAEAYIRLEEVNQHRGSDPEPQMQLAVQAADRALECGPTDSSGWTKKSYAYHFAAEAAQNRGETEKAKTLYRWQIGAGKAAIAIHPKDAYAFEMLGVAHEFLAILSVDAGNLQVEEDLSLAVKYFSQAIAINKSFTWAYNDLAFTLIQHTRTLAKTDPKIRDDLHRAIELLNVSLKIDDHQSRAEDSLEASYQLLASWQIESGGDPGEQLAKAHEHAMRALALNPNLFSVFGNIGKTHIALARYALDKGQDGRADARQAIANFEKLIQINDKIGLAYSELCNANSLLAHHELLQGQPATDALAAGHQAISRCYALDPNYLECQMQEARLYAVEAAWLRRSAPGKATPALERALTGIEKLLAKCPNDIDCLLPFAEISLQALGQDGPRRASILSAGLSATETILKQSPGWPRAMALQAALLWTGLDVAQTESERKKRTLRANELFEKALAGNPRLGNLYGELARAARAGSQR